MQIKSTLRNRVLAGLVFALALAGTPTPAHATSKEIIELQTQVQQLLDMVQRLQSTLRTRACAFCLSPLSLTLIKHPSARSHFAAARAISRDSLPFASRRSSATARITALSPVGSAAHQSGLIPGF